MLKKSNTHLVPDSSRPSAPFFKVGKPRHTQVFDKAER